MGSVAVNPPKTPVTKGSNGVAPASIPNICKMPGPPAPFVPTPLPNIGKSSDSPKGYSKKVKIEGNAVAIKGASFKSMGDVASKGLGGGMVSMNTHGATKFVGPGSFDVKIEGKNTQLFSDPMLNNCGPSGSPANSATLAGELQLALPFGIGLPAALDSSEKCPTCKTADGRTKSEKTKSYDEFFDESERAQLDALMAANPDMAAMFPPRNGQFQMKSARKGRASFEKLKKAKGAKGTYHHPHPIGAGGCPVHQELVKKPDDPAEAKRFDDLDAKVQGIVNTARLR